MRVVIVDDEAPARRILTKLIEDNCPQISSIHSAEDILSAVKLIKETNPHIVFLDIEMPVMNGFKLFEYFENPMFEVVFTTAYNQYALKAFEVSAIDYILKPIQINHLIKAVNKAESMILKTNQTFHQRLDILELGMKEPGIIQKIALPVSDGHIFVHLNDIIYFEADGSYTHIFLTDGSKIMVSKYLKDYIQIINHPSFYKPHRSFYINLSHIKKYSKQDGGIIIMSNDKEISLSRDNKDDFFEKLMITK